MCGGGRSWKGGRHYGKYPMYVIMSSPELHIFVWSFLVRKMALQLLFLKHGKHRFQYLYKIVFVCLNGRVSILVKESEAEGFWGTYSNIYTFLDSPD